MIRYLLGSYFSEVPDPPVNIGGVERLAVSVIPQNQPCVGEVDSETVYDGGERSNGATLIRGLMTL